MHKRSSSDTRDSKQTDLSPINRTLQWLTTAYKIFSRKVRRHLDRRLEDTSTHISTPDDDDDDNAS